MALRNVLKLVAQSGGGGYDDAEKGVFIMTLATAAISPAAVNTITAPEQTFTLTGAKVGDVVIGVDKPTDQAGLAIGQARITAADTVGIKFVNPTAGNITPTASQVYKITILRINA